jgi:hypothetical protein
MATSSLGEPYELVDKTSRSGVAEHRSHFVGAVDLRPHSASTCRRVTDGDHQRQIQPAQCAIAPAISSHAINAISNDAPAPLPPLHRPRRFDPLTTVYDPGCIKTPESQKRGEWISQINQDWPRSEIVTVVIAVRRDSCSINFPRAAFLHSQDPNRPFACLKPRSRTSGPLSV